MDLFPFIDVSRIPYLIVTLLIAFAVHEFAHAYTAYKFGDPTAKNAGRLTLSPLAHLDIFGTIMIFIAGFGWAKPVPVNRFYFKNPRLAGVLVSVAGPLSNLLLAAVGYFIWFALLKGGVVDGGSANTEMIMRQFFTTFISLNVVLFVFNLLPLPPLDGYRIIEDLSPAYTRAKLTQYESFGIVIFLLIVITPLERYTIQPLFTVVVPAVMSMLQSITAPIFF